MSDPLDDVRLWPGRAAVAWADTAGPPTKGSEGWSGPVEEPFPWASVTKLVSAVAVWVAVEEGTAAWEDPVGPPGSTLAHLLAHASGLAANSDRVLAVPGTRRVYSNRGFEVAAEHVAAASGLPFATYATEAVLNPLGMGTTEMAGSPASGASGPLTDLMRLARELASPTLVSPATHREATAVCFPGLAGVLPGFGPQESNDWGLGVEIRDGKAPHWTGATNNPATFGHFGRSGSLLWVDPVASIVMVSLSDLPFGPWAADAWPRLADSVLQGAASGA